jgi:hypothetical protein
MYQELSLNLTAEDILKAQGGDPSLIRKRKPKLYEIAKWAVREGNPLVDLKVIQKTYAIQRFVHEKLALKNADDNKNYYLSGPLIARHLALAEEVTAIVCTIGESVETIAAEVMNSDPLHGWALDSFGSAAVELHSEKIYKNIESLANAKGKNTSFPLSPGMVGWPVEVGQRELFNLLEPSKIGVSLNDSYQMYPAKTLSLIIGTGRKGLNNGKTCDYCAMNATCQYQNHYL